MNKKTTPIIAPAIIALGLMSAPVFAGDVLGTESEGADSVELGGNADSSLSDRTGELRSDFEDARAERMGSRGDLREQLQDSADDAQSRLSDARSEAEDSELSEMDAGDGGLQDSLPGLSDLDHETEVSRDDDGVDLSSSTSGTLGEQSVESSSEFHSSRESEDGSRSVNREASGQLSAGDFEAGYDSSADRSSSVSRSDAGVDIERSASTNREAALNDSSVGISTESSSSRSIETSMPEGEVGDGEMLDRDEAFAESDIGEGDSELSDSSNDSNDDTTTAFGDTDSSDSDLSTTGG